MKKYILKYTFALLLIIGVGTIAIACDDADKEIAEFDLDRVLTPYDIKSELLNITELKLTWKAMQGAEGYIIEIYADSMEFKEENFVLMDEVLSNVYENKTDLIGSTQYSARIQSVSTTNNDSKWNGVAFKTGFKSVFLPREDGDVTINSIKFRVPSTVTATEIVLLAAGEEVVRCAVTKEELSAGIIEIDGLTPSTVYVAKLYNGKTLIGEKTEETAYDASGGILVKPTDDLQALIDESDENQTFLLAPGTYSVGKLSITKNATIIAAPNSTSTPVLSALISLEASVSFTLKDVILDGAGAVDEGINADQAIQFNTADTYYGSITISGSEIKNYKKGLLYFNVAGTAESLTIDNCIIHDIECDGGDFLDFRKGVAKEINFTRNTVYNMIGKRDLFRIDAITTFPGVSVTLTVDKCTLVGISMGSKRILYVRYADHTTVFTNNLVTDTDAMFSNQGATKVPTFGGNNYHNAANLVVGGAGAKFYDESGVEQDPQFKDAANGDFTVENAGVIAGDPRWIK